MKSDNKVNEIPLLDLSGSVSIVVGIFESRKLNDKKIMALLRVNWWKEVLNKSGMELNTSIYMYLGMLCTNLLQKAVLLVTC